MPLTRVPVHLTPSSSDKGVPPVAAPTLRSTVIHVKNSMSNSTLFDLDFTTIVYSQLHAEWESYPFEADKLQLLHRVKFGFLLHYAGPRVPKKAKNLKSAREAPEILKQKLAKEVTLDRIGGPFDTIPFPTLQVSPVGLVPPKDGVFRLIHHLGNRRNALFRSVFARNVPCPIRWIIDTASTILL